MEPVQPTPQPAPAPQSTQSKPANGLGITALVVGIVAFCFGWAAVFGMVIGAVAVVFGIVALKKKQNKAMGIVGIVLGGLAFLTSLSITLFAAAILNNAPAISEQIQKEQQREDDTVKDNLVISNSTYKDGEYSKEVVGEIKNNNSTKRSATLKATFYDADGKIIGTASGFVSDIAAGETKTFNLYTTDNVAGYEDIKVQIDSAY